MRLIKGILAVMAVSICAISATAQQPVVKDIKLQGHVGAEIQKCIDMKVKPQSVDMVVEPFRHHHETERWQTEFWGKWILGAIDAYKYCHDKELYDSIASAANMLMSTQLPNGYIGNYSPEAQLRQWDIWGRKYTCLGLLKWHDLSGDKKALKSARKVIDHLLTQVGEGKTNIAHTGNYFGMASSSILEPVVYLYNHTGEKKYLEFAEYIVRQWEEAERGARLISKADLPVAHRFPPVSKENWFSPDNGHKAYEMMSCYEGLIELGKITNHPEYIEIAENVVRHIVDEEIYIVGSGSSFESWYGGRALQTLPTYHSMETCVTFTWMQLLNRLLGITHNSHYADLMETTIYNALLSSINLDGTVIAKYVPLEGARTEGEDQCEMPINCCTANAPRAFAMIPHATYACHSGNRVDVNFYIPGTAEIAVGKQTLTLTQKHDYPKTNTVEIDVNYDGKDCLPIALRIPSWTHEAKVAVNGEVQKGVKPGEYFVVERAWKAGDKIEIEFEMATRVTTLNNCKAITRGPVVFARDSRFGDGFVDEPSAIQMLSGDVVESKIVDSPDWAWITIEIPMIMGTALEREPYNEVVKKKLCNFSSAGNTWDHNERYRLWLPAAYDTREK